MTQRKTAYLILAHDQPDHLTKLIGALDLEDCGVFIHIDQKVEEGAFKDSLGNLRNLVFIGKRFTVNWGGLSQVEATIALLSVAFPHFHRYCLLSGSDYRIKNKSLIQAEFASDKEFIRIDRKIGVSQENPHCRNVLFEWFMDSQDPDVRALSGSRRRNPFSRIPLYQGAQWWALTHECVDYIFRFLSSNADYCSSFRYARCPDEVFFHSIVKHSPSAGRITHDFETTSGGDQFSQSNEHGCHYIDWNAHGEDKLPKVLDLGDLDRLRGSKALFARKFREGRSAALVSALDDQLAE
jgi:hypothetical protein